jgi:hypothetical protein
MKLRRWIGLGIGIAVSLSGLTAMVHASEQQAAIETAPIESNPLHTFTDYTRMITVKVITGDRLWGSGVLIQRQGQTYTVITNRHVLEFGTTYQIQTADGNFYSATVVQQYPFESRDLSALTFESPSNQYAVAILGRSSQLQVGDPVLTAGFPLRGAEPNGLRLTTGRIALVTQKSFAEGYQIGYTNTVQKGMSGGPVLNAAGELVALNGIHAFPLWADSYEFQDGSSPCPALRELMVQSSWGIPIEVVLQEMGLMLPASELAAEPLSFWVVASVLSFLGFEPHPPQAEALPVIQEMQQRAAAAQQCLPITTVPGES